MTAATLFRGPAGRTRAGGAGGVLRTVLRAVLFTVLFIVLGRDLRRAASGTGGGAVRRDLVGAGGAAGGTEGRVRGELFRAGVFRFGCFCCACFFSCRANSRAWALRALTSGATISMVRPLSAMAAGAVGAAAATSFKAGFRGAAVLASALASRGSRGAFGMGPSDVVPRVTMPDRRGGREVRFAGDGGV
ncbi:MAG: hypothetical protein DRJ42_06445 [Deltaproteobacteria bacterium]|nr:MAG: hypothetical protein DRJ42_06445 [Deltaproteobacteria bacterium]